MRRHFNPVNRYPLVKLGDHVYPCQICGVPWPFSKTKKLPKYTGKDGLRVCPLDYDKVAYGLKPYKIRKENTPKETNSNDLIDDSLPYSRYGAIDWTNNSNGYMNSPEVNKLLASNWNEIELTWEELYLLWHGGF